MLLAALLAMPAAGAAPPLYHSPNDDGVSGGVPAVLPAGQTLTLHLYLGVGTTVSSADPCHQGDGDEICGHRLALVGSGVDLQSFAPADPDLLHNLDASADRIDLTGGNFQTGELGPTKLGDLVIDAGAEGATLDLVLGEFVTTQLTLEQAAVPTSIVTLPEATSPVTLGLGCALVAALCARRRRQDRSSR